MSRTPTGKADKIRETRKHNKNANLEDIAKIVNTSRQYVWYVLARSGLPTRREGKEVK